MSLRHVVARAVLGGLALLFSTVPAFAQARGFLTTSTSPDVRPLLSASQIESFVPARGGFTFPSPYLTQGARITNASDCGGSDCVNYVGYSYWRNMNNHVGSDTILIFLGLDRNHGGGGPTLFGYSKSSRQVTNLGPLFDPSNALSGENGEGWYWSHSRPNTLYVKQNSGSQLLRYDVSTRQLETVFDVASQYGADKYLWQVSSSDDDRVHAGTLRQAGSWEMLGCVAYREDTRQFWFFPKNGDFDECQLDKSGRYLIIKEKFANDPANYDVDDLIVDLQTGSQRIITDPQGAGGHSDTGYGYMVAADNWYPQPNTFRLWDLNQTTLQGSAPVYYGTEWNTATPTHISHTNARSDLPATSQYVCGSSANTLSAPFANEIICFTLDGSRNVLVVAPVMTDLNAPGGGSDPYAKLPKGNLDVTGQYFIWTSNMAGNRLDAFIVEVPAQSLTSAASAPTPAPAPPPASPSGSNSTSGQNVTWTNLVNATASGSTLQKSGGCDGCYDSGARSQQQIASGDGYAQFTVGDTAALRLAGLTSAFAVQNASTINFGFRLQNGVAEIRESGAYRSETPFVTGDVLRVTVNAGVVSYSKNGTVVYTSQLAPTYPLFMAGALANSAATLNSAMMGTSGVSGGVSSAAAASAAAAASGSVQNATWTNLVNAAASGSSLTKAGGCDGCYDAGARSQQQIASGDGYAQFTASDTAALRLAGLTSAFTVSDAQSIAFGIRLQNGVAEIRESGVYRSETPFGVGDVFRISVKAGVVSYSKNGTVFYTSTVAPSYPLYIAAALANSGASVGSAVISTQLTAAAVPEDVARPDLVALADLQVPEHLAATRRVGLAG